MGNVYAPTSEKNLVYSDLFSALGFFLFAIRIAHTSSFFTAARIAFSIGRPEFS